MPNPDNIRGLLDTKSPTTTKEAFRSVKAAEYYRKFISHFFQIAGPLYKYAPTAAQQCDKRSQSSKIVLSLNKEAAFNEVKRILTTDLVLRLPNNVLPFKLQTDASDEDDLRQQQQKDRDVQQIIQNIKAKNYNPKYFVENDLLMRRKNPLPPDPYVPKSRIRSDTIKIYHDTPANGAHFGRDKLTKKNQHRYFWPTMTLKISQIISNPVSLVYKIIIRAENRSFEANKATRCRLALAINGLPRTHYTYFATG
ncbi:unnamed protein product [Didymodactylos carnosus]|uniref:Integrase zinc-binding domain-containing protein n=1 Tax=Didymodactylos carnosus TaxID=1234261 RepID=A0A815B062_9BILA|nr:unnamed protein product [Didymodactylos carnosus]CAF1262520.1 unnamed protein product [Didymodactylos carnosus]CAF3794643.1 unnamed protein product [Didymodactylos carnosus]CAF4041838.1 unnamed protein product [Didymodactylos carnosus]